MPNDQSLSLWIGLIGIIAGGLFGALPKILETFTASGKARAEARRVEAETERINAENELARSKRDQDELMRLTIEVNRLRKKLLDNGIDPVDSRPMERKPQG